MQFWEPVKIRNHTPKQITTDTTLRIARSCGPRATPHPLDTPHIIEAGGNTRSSTTKLPRPGQPRRAKYRISNTLREMFFENGTFSPKPRRGPDLKYLVRRFCAKQWGEGGA